MTKIVYGVGYNSKREHKTKTNGKNTTVYSTWVNMIKRCYDKKTQEIRPTYKGYSVDERWHDFQDFADWFYSHNYSQLGYQLDKDILKTNNKVYGPDTCCFVPGEINNLLLDNAAARGMLPQGVSWNKQVEKYMVTIKIDGKKKYLGCFDCLKEASHTYKVTKEAYVKTKALKWQEFIAVDVFEALMKWQLRKQ